MAKGNLPAPRRQSRAPARRKPSPIQKPVRRGLPARQPKKASPSSTPATRRKRLAAAFVLGLLAGIVTLYLAFFAEGIRFQDRWSQVEEKREADFTGLDELPMRSTAPVSVTPVPDAEPAIRVDPVTPQIQAVAQTMSAEPLISTVYLLRETDRGPALVSVPLSPPITPTAAVSAMRDTQLAVEHRGWSAIPEGLAIQSIRREGATAFVSVNETIGTLSRDDFRAAMAQLGKTFLQLDQVNRVQLLIDQQPTPSIGIHGFPNDALTETVVTDYLAMLQPN